MSPLIFKELSFLSHFYCIKVFSVLEAHEKGSGDTLEWQQSRGALPNQASMFRLLWINGSSSPLGVMAGADPCAGAGLAWETEAPLMAEAEGSPREHCLQLGGGSWKPQP